MDIANATATASALTTAQQAPAGQQEGVQLLRMALDLQQAQAQQLIQAVPEPPAADPSATGSLLDTYA